MNTTLSNPLVSVVIATYNGERFLQEQLESIISQTYTPIEIIAIDDCSTDNTFSILNRYAAQHPHFILIRNEQNLGYQKNFEKGFALAKGDYIAPSDQDDIWLPNKIETLVNNIGQHAIAYCNSAFINSASESMDKTMNDIKILANFDNPIMYVTGASAPGHAMLITRQLALDAMPYPTLVSHDYWLAFVATFNSSLKFIDEVLVLYRRHDTNVFGAINSKNKVRENAQQRVQKARERVQLLYQKCPDYLTEQKQAFYQICKSYESYSLANNFARMRIFFKYRKEILSYKKRNELRRCLYCLKVFFRII
ncbi:MAG: glycosyltransferase family 2 protein [Methylococcales bacterium]|nr:glycosyltransferase family 2 protein [Methylococcales bacterium]